MKRCLAVCVLVCAPVTASLADAVLSVSQIVAIAEENSAELRDARRQVQAAHDDLLFPSELRNSSIWLSSYLYSSYDTWSDAVAADASISIPFLRQLSLGARVSSDGYASASLSYSPFEPRRTDYWEKAALRSAEIWLEYRTAELRSTVESAAYRLLIAEATVATADMTSRVLSDRYDVAHRAFQGGSLAYEDLELARARLRTATEQASAARLTSTCARSDLQAILGPAEDAPVVQEVTVDQLITAVAERDARLAAADLSQPRSVTLRLADLEQETQRKRLSATPPYRPDLHVSLTGSYSFDSAYGSPLSASGGLSFRFSPSYIKTDERKEITRDLEAATDDVEDARTASRFEARRLQEVLQLARDDHMTAKQELTRTESILAEVVGLQALGQTSPLDVEQARIAVEAETTRVFASLAAILNVQDSLLLLCGG